MCLWILTACMSMLPANPPPATNIIVLPTPILQPTPAPTTPTFQTFPTFQTVPTVITVQTPAPIPIGPTNPVPGNMTVTPPPPALTSPISTTTPAPSPTNPSSTVTNTPVIGEDIEPLIFCDDPDSVCLVNPKSASGPPQIDPRLGTTSSPSSRLLSPMNTAVRFPREKRSADGPSVKEYISQLPERRQHVISKRQACSCVVAGTCATSSSNFGAGMIDIRVVTPGAQCPAGQVYCCTGTGGGATVACGVQQAVPAIAVSAGAGQASFGEYPWQALILTTQNDYLAGGVLIDQLNVVTVTHRMVPYIVGNTAPNVKVRLGEWDAAGVYEPIPYQEFAVARTFSHPSYNPNTLQFDVTILRLSRTVPLTPMAGSAPTINRACLPPSASSAYTGQRCYISGWGKNTFGVQGQYQQILKEVDVPIVASQTCQAQMQAARLGSTFMLDTTSFICAGGEANKDACTGDGGSGLVCQVNGQWVVVGLVAWGLGCASANVPGAYVNIAGLLPWIQQQVATP